MIVDIARPPVASLLVCTVCRGDLDWGESAASCSACARSFPIVDGIPIFLDAVADADHDELDHEADQLRDEDHGQAGHHKQRQADHFDRMAAEEFEIVRPHGTPRLYRWILNDKFRRAISPISKDLRGSTAITVCGGSGMDAEFLARAGASVISSDISLGAARRARERARRRALDVWPIVADVEHLPFRDGTVDLAFVHDGLHHLERPAVGLLEMARVARRWVAVTEPARAAVTAVAIKFGWALDAEESGNQVMRLAPDEVLRVLKGEGFERLVGGRYATYYRHEPGAWVQLMSRPVLFQVVTACFRLGDRLIGRYGNKMVVVAVRRG
jgi:SAM-dependent methyltransferase